MMKNLGENIRRKKVRPVFMKQMEGPSSEIEKRMRGVVLAWISGVLTEREFTNTLLFDVAMLEEPEGRSIYFFESKLDEVMRKALDRVKDGDLWHPASRKDTKAALGRSFMRKNINGHDEAWGGTPPFKSSGLFNFGTTAPFSVHTAKIGNFG